MGSSCRVYHHFIILFFIPAKPDTPPDTVNVGSWGKENPLVFSQLTSTGHRQPRIPGKSSTLRYWKPFLVTQTIPVKFRSGIPVINIETGTSKR